MKRLTKILTGAVLVVTLFVAGLLSRQVLAAPGDPPRPTVTAVPSELTYTDEVIGPEFVGYDPATMNIWGHEHFYVGNHSAVITSKTGRWADGSVNGVTVDWKIVPLKISSITATGYTPTLEFGKLIKYSDIMYITAPADAPYHKRNTKWQKLVAGEWQDISYDESLVTPATAGKYRARVDFATNWPGRDACFTPTTTIEVSGMTWEAGEISDDGSPNDSCRIKTFSPVITINDNRPVKPTNLSPNNLEYNGSEQTVTINNFNPETMKFVADSVHKATVVGDYVAKVGPKNGQWNDGTSDPVEVNWYIYQKSIQEFEAVTYNLHPPVLGQNSQHPEMVASSTAPYTFNALWTKLSDSGNWLAFEPEDGPVTPGIYKINVMIEATNQNYLMYGYNGTITINGDIYNVNYISTNLNRVGAFSEEYIITDSGSAIHPAKPNIPAPADLTYNGSNQSPVLTGFNAATMNVTGGSALSAGNYIARITSRTGQWEDGTTDAVEVNWKINKQALNSFNADVYNFTTPLVVGENLVVPNITAPAGAPYKYYYVAWRKKNGANWENTVSQITDGVYAVWARIILNDSNYTMAGLSVGDTVTVHGETWTVLEVDSPSSITVLSPEFVAVVPANPVKPSISVVGSLYYNGSAQSPVLSGFDASKMDIAGNTGTNAGMYSATITSKTGQWNDGSTDAVTVSWEILKGFPSVTIPTGLEAMITDTVGSVTLPAGFSWNNPSAPIALGSNVYIATFVPTDTANYNNLTDVPIMVMGRDYSYDFIEGADQTYTVGVDTDAVFKIDGAFGLFDKVLVDGVELDAAHYIAEDGSVRITLLQSYLGTLADGMYRLQVNFTNDRVARTQFTVRRGLPAQPGTSGNAAAPATGSYGNNLVLLVSATSLILLGWLGLLTHRRSVKQAN